MWASATEISSRNHHTPRKFYRPSPPAHRTLAWFSFVYLRALCGWIIFSSPLRTHRNTKKFRATCSSRIEALIKIYSLVDCPIYSVIKHRPHQLALIHPPQQVWVLLRADG